MGITSAPIAAEAVLLRLRIIESDDVAEVIVLEDEHVVSCPPDLRFMVGWDIDSVLAFVAGHGWRLDA